MDVRATLIAVLVGGLAWAHAGEASSWEAPFRAGIATHGDWIERLRTTNDARIFYLLASRCGNQVELLEAEELCVWLGRNPDGFDPLMAKWSISIDNERFVAGEIAAWRERFGERSFTFETPHYQVLATTADAAHARLVAKYMELIFARYAAVIGLREAIAGRFLIKVCPDLATLAAIYGKEVDYAGFYDAQSRSLVGRVRREAFPGRDLELKKDLIHTFFHEGFHQFLGYHVPNLPPWLNEGLAEYFNGTWINGDDLVLDRSINRVRAAEHLRAAIQDGRLTSFRELVHFDSTTFYENADIWDRYHQSWSLIHFLSRGPREVQAIYQKVLAALANGAGRQQAIDEGFAGVDWDKLDAAWRKYIIALRPKGENDRLVEPKR